MCQLLWWFVFWCLNSFLTACVLLMFFHAVSYTFFFFSNSTFADGHCKGHNLLLSWHTYMNCAQRRRKHAKNQEGNLLRTHPHSTALNPHSWRFPRKTILPGDSASPRDHLDDPSASPHIGFGALGANAAGAFVQATQLCGIRGIPCVDSLA